MWRHLFFLVTLLPPTSLYQSHQSPTLTILRHNSFFRIWTFLGPGSRSQENKGNKWQMLSSGFPKCNWNFISVKQMTSLRGWAELLMHVKEKRRLDVGLSICALPLQDRWYHLPFSIAFLASNLHELWDNAQLCLICKSGNIRDRYQRSISKSREYSKVNTSHLESEMIRWSPPSWGKKNDLWNQRVVYLSKYLLSPWKQTVR